MVKLFDSDSGAVVLNLSLAMLNLGISKILMSPFVNCLIVFARVSPRVHVLPMPHVGNVCCRKSSVDPSTEPCGTLLLMSSAGPT